MNNAFEHLKKYPVWQSVDQLRMALSENKRAVLSSPTGSGKSTVLPLALLDEAWVQKRKIIILEPRRIATYAVASQLARNYGCEIGDTVGYRMRLERKVSANTRIEVLTEGMLTRKLQRDPELADTALIIFDEFHERSLQSDLALALTLDCAESLRDDLRILLMSATLDTQKASALLGNAPVIESQGRCYPVKKHFVPRNSNLSLSENTAQVILEAYRSESGSMLVFLPGEGDIKAVESLLRSSLNDTATYIVPLYGRLDNFLQRQAIEPPPAGQRKIVLATSIAESSLTIDGVRLVVDCGFTRIARLQVASGLERLETVPISQASAAQRAGRAGRTEPGVVWKLWSEHEDSRREANHPSQISYCDLTDMVLELAAWGVSDPGQLKFMDPPPEAAWKSAVENLQQMGILDKNNRISAHGKLVHECGLSVRAGHLIAISAKLDMAQTGVKLAALLDAVDMRRNNCSDITLMLKEFDHNKSYSQAQRLAATVRKRLNGKIADHDKNDLSVGALLAAAYPMRVAKRRGAAGELRYLSSPGREVVFRELNNLAGYEFIVALNLDDRVDNALITLAAGVEYWEIVEMLSGRFEKHVELKINPADLAVETFEECRLGALSLKKLKTDAPDRQQLCSALARVIRKESLAILHLPSAVEKLQEKLALIHKYDKDSDLPELSNQYILDNIEELLMNFLPEKASKNMMKNIDWFQAISSLLDYQQQRLVNTLLPEKVTVENGRDFKVDYSSNPPALEGKLQFFFGTRKQPALLNGKLPLVIRLLSPAGRPVQTTSDIGNFWSGSYKLVRNDLKGRYPKHDWPENP